MSINWEGLDLSILGPACVAGLVVLSTHVPLGKQVLARGIIFIDLAIAQIAALGVIAAGWFGIDEHGLGVEVAAAVAALLGAALLSWTDRRWPPRAGCCCWPTTRKAASTSRTCWSARSCGSATPS